MKISNVMTPDPRTCRVDAPLSEAARVMRDAQIGDVLVTDQNDTLCGIVTDRDLVIRGLAEGDRAAELTLGDICTSDVETVTIDADVSDVVRLMEEKALRRVPVVSGQRAVGIVTLGDLAQTLDSDSALGQISSAPPQE